MELPTWAKQVTAPRLEPQTEHVQASEPVVATSAAMTAEEYEAEVQVDETEVEAEDVLEPGEPLAPEEEAAYLAEAEDEEEPDEEDEPKEPKPPQPRPKLEAWVKAKALRDFFAKASALVEDVKVVVDKEGWHAIFVDPAHVALGEVHLPRGRTDGHVLSWAFNPDPSAPIPETFEFGANLTVVQSWLRKADGEVVHLVAEYQETGGVLSMQIGNGRRSTFLVDTEGMSDPKLPTLDLPVTFRVDAATLEKIIKQAGDVADYVEIAQDVVDGHPRLRASAGDSPRDGMWEGEFPEEAEWIATKDERVRSNFPLDYLEKLVKALKGRVVEIDLGTDYPARFKWSNQPRDGFRAEQATFGLYMLAPRIETEE